MSNSDYKYCVVRKPKWVKGSNKFEENCVASSNSHIISNGNDCCISDCILSSKILENGKDGIYVGCDRHKLILFFEDSEIGPTSHQKNSQKNNSITVLDSNISNPPSTDNGEKILNLTKIILQSLEIEYDNRSLYTILENINRKLNSLDTPLTSVCGCENFAYSRAQLVRNNFANAKNAIGYGHFINRDNIILTDICGYKTLQNATSQEVVSNDTIFESNLARKFKAALISEQRYDWNIYADNYKRTNVADNTSRDWTKRSSIKLDNTYASTENGNTSVRKNNEGDFLEWRNKLIRASKWNDNKYDIFECNDRAIDLPKCNNKADCTSDRAIDPPKCNNKADCTSDRVIDPPKCNNKADCTSDGAIDPPKCNNKADCASEKDYNGSDPFERISKEARNLDQTNKADYTSRWNDNDITTSDNWFDKVDNISEWFDRAENTTKITETSDIVTSSEKPEIQKNKAEEKAIREQEATGSTEMATERHFSEVRKTDPNNEESKQSEESPPKTDSTDACNLTIFYKQRKNWFDRTFHRNNKIHSYQIDKAGDKKSCDIRVTNYSLRCTVHDGSLYTIGYYYEKHFPQLQSFNKATAHWRDFVIPKEFRERAADGKKMQIATLHDRVVIFLSSRGSALPQNYLWTCYPSYGLINNPTFVKYQPSFVASSCMTSDLSNTVYFLGKVAYTWDLRTVRVQAFPNPSKFRIKPAACYHERSLYMCGGRTSKKLNTLEILDLRANKWRDAAPMKFERKSHTLVPFEENIWCLGGTKSDVVEIYNPVRDKWTVGPLGNPSEIISACVL